MPAFFIALFKINLALALFAVAYYLILRRLTFYTINRAFLVFGILFSTVYPFINLSNFFHNQKQISQKIVEQVKDLVSSDTIAAYWIWISIFFWAGVIVMAARLIIQFVSLRQLHKRSTPGFIGNLPVRMLDESVSPFSFWRNIYVNPHLHKEAELNNILAHENVHVKEWHTLDIILAELSVVFYWFNPGVWLMKKAVKENLEFITDEKVLRKGIDKKAYQYSLLDVGSLKNSAPIVNSFNLSDLKKRIKMMNVKRSSKLTLSRYFLVLPVLLVITLAFTISKKEATEVLRPFSQAFINGDNPQAEIIENTTAPIKQPVKAKDKRSTMKMTKANTATGSQVSTENNLAGTIPGSALAETITIPPIEVMGHRRVTGINLDTVNRATAPPTDDKQKEITVMGYSKKKSDTTHVTESNSVKLNVLPSSNAGDSLVSAGAPAAKDNAEEKPYKVVVGYKSPRAAEKQKN
jgi:hypothetical protein